MTGKPTDLVTRDLTVTRPFDGTPDRTGSTEEVLADMLADVTGLTEVSVDSHFFDELGADSLVMAHFCARVRKQPDLPPVSMKEVYRHPTIRSLTAALAEPAPAPPADAAPAPLPAPTGRPRYVLCGALQALAFLVYACVIALLTAEGFTWISAGSGWWDTYLRSVEFGAVTLAVLCVLPVLAKWILIGRWTPRQIRVWSLGYVRFWIVKTLVRSNPLVLFAGSPLYVLYLRALGARIGRGVTILSRNVPVCTDLLTIGDDTIVRKDSLLSCYRAHDGLIQTGRVTLGRGVVVSEATVIDIDTSLSDGSQLGHASSLHAGQTVPDGEHWAGSPAFRTDADFQVVAPMRCGVVRRTKHGLLLLLATLLVYVPVAAGGVEMLLAAAPQLTTVLEPGPAVLTDWAFYADMLTASALVFFAVLPVSLLLLAAAPRLLHRFVTPGRTYPLYGFHHWVHRSITVLSNRKFLTRLFGDSSSIVAYLRWIGYDLSHVEQTGSNFGTQVKHESPFLSSVGSGTMVADGLSIMNTDYSSSSFRVSRTSIGARNFLGNRIAYPSRSRTGDNCLLATKVMVPVDGAVRKDVGLLGSPSFEIPRSVQRDGIFDELRSGPELRRLLAAKNRHNAATMALYLTAEWIHFFWVTMLYCGATDLYPRFGMVPLALANLLVLPLSVVHYVLVERAVTALRPLGPLFCSIYDRRFWRRERFWKVPAEAYLRLFNGTPFKSVVWRLLGVRIGRRVFDDGCALTERTMVTIGDGCTLNAGSVVQCHSQEDGTFKSDRSTVGSGCTLGVGAFVHYGVTIGDRALLEADSFLMKGENVPEGAQWSGNPAHPIRQGSDMRGREF